MTRTSPAPGMVSGPADERFAVTPGWAARHKHTLFRAAAAAFGGVDRLVNNAGNIYAARISELLMRSFIKRSRHAVPPLRRAPPLDCRPMLCASTPLFPD